MNRKERAVFVLAGHAVGAHLSGIPVIKLSVVPTEDANSWIEVDEPILPDTGCFIQEQDRIAARALIVALLAGPAAGERVSFGECRTALEYSRDLLRRLLRLAGRKSCAPTWIGKFDFPPPLASGRDGRQH